MNLLIFGAIVNNWKMSEIAHMCADRLGMTIRQEHDPARAIATLEGMGKHKISPILDPRKNVFTRSNYFWIFADIEGVPMIAACVRMDDIRGEDINDYWARALRLQFGQQPRQHSIKVAASEVSGRIAYFGDLFSRQAANLGGKAKHKLRLFSGICHHIVATDLSPDVTCCFITDKDAQRGAGIGYGFLDSTPVFMDWPEPPYDRGKPDWLAYTKREKLPALMCSLKHFTGE